MDKNWLAYPIFSAPFLARRIRRLWNLQPAAAHKVAGWLLAPDDSWPDFLIRYRAICPDPQTLLRLITFFEPSSGNQSDTLLEHLTTGWQRGQLPAPWFDPLGYEVLIAARRDPSEAAILHYAKEGWARGLDPDPRQICDLSKLDNCSLLLTVNQSEQKASTLAFLDRHLHVASVKAVNSEFILLDTSPDHGTARALATKYSSIAGHNRLRILAADAKTPEPVLAQLVCDEAANERLLALPTCVSKETPSNRISIPEPALHLIDRRSRLRRGEIAPRITLRCPAPDLTRAHRWGDFHFAESLAAALRSLGCETTIVLAEDWQTQLDPVPDATLLLRGVRRCRPRPGPVNVMWMISHPDRIEMEELSRYDHVFVASLPHAASLQKHLENRVSALLQCSDPTRFLPQSADHAAEAETPRHPLLFVGNSRRTERWIISSLLASGHAPTIYGAEWEDTPAGPYVLGKNLPNTQLGSYYRRAGIVLNDHWPDMAARGFVSNRIFDVAMAKGFLISDSFEGSGMFFGQLTQVRGPKELDDAIRYFSTQPEERLRRAAALHDLVRDRHTFANRAAALLSKLRQLF